MQAAFAISQFTIGTIGAVVAVLLYRLNCQMRLDHWHRTLREFHQFFWMDDSCTKVRAWLACDAAYEEIRPILKKRVSDIPLTPDEYTTIETIDRFAALLLAYKKVEPDSPRHRDISYRLFDAYWLNCLKGDKRPELRRYIELFFDELL